jgi:putative protein kinase ArgK-like GTPase of G3E family
MLWLGLKLLGIKQFLLDNWKWVLPVVAIVAAFFIVSSTYYDKGIQAERTTWEARVKAESAKNVETTKEVKTAVVDYGATKQKEAEVRIKKETVYKDRILTLIKEIPADCKVSQEILDSRNAIRAEGP